MPWTLVSPGLNSSGIALDRMKIEPTIKTIELMIAPNKENRL